MTAEPLPAWSEPFVAATGAAARAAGALPFGRLDRASGVR